MAQDPEQKALKYIQDAEKKLNMSKGFFGFFGGSSRVDEAIELYIHGANCYKMAKIWSNAGNAFTEAANLHMKVDSRHDSAQCFIDAALCYRKVDHNEAVNCMLKAIEIYTDMGRFTIAAKHHMTVAEIYENDVQDLEKAISHFEQAADYYKGEESVASANRCLLNVARYAAALEQFQKAVDIYESVGSSCIENSLLKYSAKDYFFRATLCHLCIDTLNAQLAVKNYVNLFPAFGSSRECKFLQTIIERIEAEDVEGFTEAVENFHAESSLDQSITNLLFKIKKKNFENKLDLL